MRLGRSFYREFLPALSVPATSRELPASLGSSGAGGRCSGLGGFGEKEIHDGLAS
jgi:hypothetical protein